MSKGFTHVLEGIMAAFLLIGAVTTIIPEIEYDDSQRIPVDRIQSRMEVLDYTDSLSNEMTTDEIKDKITEQITSSYSFGVTKLTLDSETKEYDLNSGTASDSYNVNGESFEMQIIIEEAGNLNISYAGQNILTQETGSGYYLRPVTSGAGDISVNGTGELDVTVNGYTFNDGDRPFETVSSVKYVETENETTQIGVFLWQPDRP